MVSAIPEMPPPSDRVSDLTEAERLVLHCFRRWLAGSAHHEMLWRQLAHELRASDARAALGGLEAMIQVLTAHAHRNIAYHHPCCPYIGPDEVGLLTLVTAVQREEPALALHVAANFVRPGGTKMLLAAADLFASALRRGTHELPLRFAFCTGAQAEGIEAEPLPAPTLH